MLITDCRFYNKLTCNPTPNLGQTNQDLYKYPTDIADTNMTKYCICRKSDSSGFMIACERCEEWFHGRCIHINKSKAERIKNYYCDACRKNNKGLEIEYKSGFEPIVKQEPQPEQPREQNQQRTIAPPKPIPITLNKRKPSHRIPKTKSKNRRQCANLDCTYESRQDSKYCTDECGLKFNRYLYENVFLPKWKNLEQNHSKVRWDKFKELKDLDEETIAIQALIKSLKEEKEELERNIKIIKEEASRMYKENVRLKENEDEDDEAENDDAEEAVTGDQAKTFCITCGHTIPSNTALKHWFSCHKKHEAVYNFTADVLVNPTCEGDENPKLYCQFQDKKTKRYCMHIESACPQHSNWLSDKDEVCACPLNIGHKLIPDGNYCLELRKDCKQHYHWDKFYLAQMNMQRVHAFSRLDAVIERKKLVKARLDDTYGGIVGVMLHNTLDHSVKKEIDVEMNES